VPSLLLHELANPGKTNSPFFDLFVCERAERIEEYPAVFLLVCVASGFGKWLLKFSLGHLTVFTSVRKRQN